jgi:hypothetical protein
MAYTLLCETGEIIVPEGAILDYKGIKLIGRDTPNWNGPIQQNFVTLIDMIKSNTVEVTEVIDNGAETTQQRIKRLTGVEYY